MSIKKKKENQIFNFNQYDLCPFFDGLDILINISIVTYLSSFIFPNIDLRVSSIFTLLVIVLSLASRILITNVFRIFCNLVKLRSFNFFLAIIICYLIPILLPPNSNFVLCLFIFIVSRISIGIIFALANYNFLISDELGESSSFFSIKYWLIFLVGIVFGSGLYLFFNEIFSNDELNRWGWKIFYVLYILILLIAFLCNLFLSNKKLLIRTSSMPENFQFARSDNIILFFKNIYIIIPIYFFLIFGSSEWLSKLCSPENMQFLSYDFLFIFLTILSTIFLYPLIKLIGNKSKSFLSSLIFIFSLALFFVDHSSSYSINFLKFFISIISSLSLCIYFFGSEKINMIKMQEIINIMNLHLFLIFFLIPLSFYYFIHLTISYNGLYVFFGLIFLCSFVVEKYGKKSR